MSNRLNIVPCEFHDVRDGEISYGYRIFDDESMSYDNNWDSIPADDMQVLRKVLAEADVATHDMLEFVDNYETGLYIGGCWYEYEEVKAVFDEHYDRDPDEDEEDDE
jgi:hypothetical protein